MAGGTPSSGPGTSNPAKILANIFISFIGAGVLGLPYAFKEAGILESATIMTFVSMISVKAMLLLVECKYRILSDRKSDRPYVKDSNPEEKQDLLKDEEEMMTRIKPSAKDMHHDINYGDVGSEALGVPGRLLVDFAIVLSQIGFCCGYLIFITRNLADFVPEVEMGKWLLIVLPPISLLTLLRNLNSLAFTSMMAQGSNLFAFGVVFWFDFEHYHSVSIHPREVSVENLPFFFVIAIYCYEGAGLILSLEASLAQEVRHKFTKYFVSTMAVVTLLYIVFGACGYLSFGPETNQIITLNLPKGKGLDFSILVKSFLCVALFCTYPIMMFPVMKILEHYFLPDAHNSLCKGNVMRGLVVLVTGMVVLAIPNFADLMALVGATCCTLLAFILPGLFHLSLFKGDLTKSQRCLDYFLIGLGILGTILGLWDALERVGRPKDDVLEPSIETITSVLQQGVTNASSLVTSSMTKVVLAAVNTTVTPHPAVMSNLSQVESVSVADLLPNLTIAKDGNS